MIQFIIPEIYILRMDQDAVKKRTEAALQLLDAKTKSLSLKICNDREIRSLNRTYRAIDRATDVLSFSLPYRDPQSDEEYLGDIIISFPTARKQAKEHHQTVEDEIVFLFIHGLLHLLGHDHDTPLKEKKMFALQDEIFEKAAE